MSTLRVLWRVVFAAALTLNVWLSPDVATRALRRSYRRAALEAARDAS